MNPEDLIAQDGTERLDALAAGLAKMLNHVGGKPDGSRFDAGETMFLAQQLEAMKAQVYRKRYPALKARQFVPVANDVNNGAETIAYRVWDMTGMAQIIRNYSDDLPSVSAFARKVTTKAEGIGDSYHYSIQDLRAAQMAGTPLESELAMAARRMIERKIDEIAAFGVADAGLEGFVNNSNVSLASVTTGSWGGGTSAAQMLQDLSDIVRTVVEQTKEEFPPDTLILPTSQFMRATQKYIENSDTTVLEAFVRTDPFIQNVDSWHKLDGAGAGGADRAICYQRNSEVLTLEMPQEFEQFPPQQKNLAFVVNCHARTGGTVVRQPLAMAYCDQL